jgi:chromosome segregation protein
MLKSIQLSGFKSFAKNDTLSFESAITAIVGPNGSGKSNTAEAFRFVLGEQGGKKMRVKKGTDLIWGGSHMLPKSSRASVKIVLDNSDHRLNVDYHEVVIERVVYRDGTNEYLVNGAKVRLKDIQDLLAGVHIGTSNHHIISQGQADRILDAGNNERREIIEDALGLKRHQFKKNESLKKLATTENNLKEAESRHRELTPQLKYLERQVKKIQEMQDLRDELKRIAWIYVLNEQKRTIQQERILKEKLQNPLQEKDHLESKMTHLREKIERVKSLQKEESNNLKDSAFDEAERVLISKRSELAQIRTELGRVHGKISILHSIQERSVSSEVQIPVSEIKVVIAGIVQYIKKGKEKKAEKVAEDFLEKITNTKQKVDEDEFARQMHDLDGEQRELQEQIVALEQSLRLAERKITALREDKQRQDSVETEYERDLYKLTARHVEVSGAVRDIERGLTELVVQKEQLRSDIGSIQILLGEELKMTSGQVPDEDITRDAIERLKIRFEQYNTVGSDVVDEYEDVKSHYEYLDKEINDLIVAKDALMELIRDLEEKISTQFTTGLSLINQEFSRFFTLLFDGGTAQLTSVENEDSGNRGVVVEVNLPRKKITTLETLSGGERALASIALIFAMSQVNPPPFIILDETDAALDEANSQRYAGIVQELAKKSQLILITHNRATMAAANALYGVTMGGDGVSQLLSVKLTEAEQFAK